MAGQGSPLSTVQRLARALLRGCWLAVALAASLQAAPGWAAEADLRLRLAWGGGEARQWQGTIRVSSGTISEVVPLGLEADSPGSMQMVGADELRVFPRMPRSYDGCDLRVQGPADAQLIISLVADGELPLAPIELPLAKALQGIQQFDLDGKQNRLLAQRSPGDQLRVKLSRDSLIFAPSEKLEFEVIPHALSLSPNTTYLLSVNVLRGRSTEVLSSDDRELKTDETGEPSAVSSYSIRLPTYEGVYDVQIALYPKRLTTSLVRGKPVAERRVQLVVVDPVKTIDRSSPEWLTQQTLDPANPSWWSSLARLPVPTLPTLRNWQHVGNKPLGNGKAGTLSHLGTTWVELAPDLWQAYPLTVAEPGRPHVLEVEFPSDLEQTLGISIVEPNAAGQVIPIGLDSGIDVSASAGESPARVARHRLVFWPQTKTPLVLLVNRRSDQPAWYGKIALQKGPLELPVLSLPDTNLPGRQLTAYFDKPLFPENFSAGEALDPATGRTLDDWHTFYLGATRLVEMLRHTGYTSAVVTVACEGSAIYPSQRLQATPKYDTGIFFENGQDPVRKDVVELLFRLFDRAGIQLIPAIQFSAPLPELEQIRLLGGAAADGLEPLGPDGRTWTARNGVRRGLAPYYNLLDERVQRATRATVQELAARYGRHPSFGGVAVHLGPETYALLPDETCSFDDTTMARFQREAEVAIAEQPATRLADRAAFVRGEGAAAWSDWRAATLARHYQQMHQELDAEHAGAKLYLTSADLLAGRQAQVALRPTLPMQAEPAEVLLHMGLDPALFAESGGIVLPRPQRIVPSTFPGGQGIHNQWNRSAELDALFLGAQRASGPAVQAFHEPSALRLPSFDQQSPFGTDKTQSWLVAQMTPAGARNRQRLVHALATTDAQTLIDGGWLLPLGQQLPLEPLVQVYRRLPAARFQTVEPRATGARTQPVVVRSLQRGSRTYFYLTNDSPWPLSVELDFDSTEPFQLESYATDREARLQQHDRRHTWTVKLQPFDLVGGEIDSARVRIDTWRVSHASDVEEQLRQKIRDVRLRVNALRSPPQRDLLTNPTFEAPDAIPGQGTAVPGWVHASGPGISVTVDGTQGHQSSRSLHMVSRPPAAGQAAPVVWVRSEPFAAPATGRISVVAWIRTDDPTRQPELRMAIEGKLDGKTYYRRANVGASEQGRTAKPLQKEWASYRFPLTDLPLAGLTDLRVGFDLMGEGEVWIDEVEVFDLWFEDNERDELLKNIATADFQLGAGQLADCERFLDGYWSRFLRQFVPLAENGLANALPAAVAPRGVPAPIAPPPAAAPAPAAENASSPPSADDKPSMMERVRNWWSKSGTTKTKRF